MPDQTSPPAAEAVDEALRDLRVAVEAQLGTGLPDAADVDVASVARFSPRLSEELDPDTAADLRKRAEALGPWLQGPFWLGGDVVVGGAWRCDHRWLALSDHLPERLDGMRVVDVGSNAGYDPFMFRLRGADYVLACEPFAFIRQARFLESIYQTGADIRPIGWQGLHPESHGQFDIVHCNGVLYHELHPVRMLQQLRKMLKPGGTLLLGSMLLADPELSEYARFVPDAYYADPTWWWVPGRLAMRWMLETAGFAVGEELGTSDGPPGEFPTISEYMVATAAEPLGASAVAATELPTGEVHTRFPLGHYYSPVPDPAELAAEDRAAQVWPETPDDNPAIDWRDAAQVELCTGPFAAQERIALAAEPTADPAEYYASNDQYPALDAWVLEAMLRHLRPTRMIEVGSGFSSLVTARVNREQLGGALDFTCIEPYPREFLVQGVDGISGLRVEQVQDTPLEVFEALEDGDVLFIDTSHTVKTGGDVPFLFNRVLPRLRRGVVVHVHDIFLPGDYPREWVLDGWGWNELYLVESFLAFNAGFAVLFGCQYMIQRHPDALLAAFPGFPAHAHRGGAALWLRRT